jgi:formylmethanofuran dehydrogenase subunit E
VELGYCAMRLNCSSSDFSHNYVIPAGFFVCSRCGECFCTRNEKLQEEEFVAESNAVGNADGK